MGANTIRRSRAFMTSMDTIGGEARVQDAVHRVLAALVGLQLREVCRGGVKKSDMIAFGHSKVPAYRSFCLEEDWSVLA